MPGLLLLLLPTASANDDGIVGQAALGCGDCHGDAASPGVAVALSGPDGPVAGGETVELVLSLTTDDPAHTAFGVDVRALDGALAPVTGLLLREHELTHGWPQPLAAGAGELRFPWTAPWLAGEVEVLASANAVDFDGSDDGDGWSQARLLLTVVSDCQDGDGDGVTDCEDDCDDGDATVATAEDCAERDAVVDSGTAADQGEGDDSGADPADAGGGGADPKPEPAGCALAPASGPLWLVGIALFHRRNGGFRRRPVA